MSVRNVTNVTNVMNVNEGAPLLSPKVVFPKR